MPPREKQTRDADTSGVAERAAEAAQRSRAGNGPGKEVARSVDSRFERQAGLLEQYRKAFDEVLPKGLEAVQITRDVMTCLRTVKRLDQVDDASLIGSVMTASQLGLRPGVLGQCWPLPFWDNNAVVLGPDRKPRKGSYRAQLVVGYKGFVELGHRSGLVESIIARQVHQHDEFEMEHGLHEILRHRPARGEDGRGPLTDVYCMIRFRPSGHVFDAMSLTEIEAHRDRYAPRTKAGDVIGPWVDNFGEMAEKTVFLKLADWMPKNPEMTLALQWDSRVRTSLDIDANPDAEDLPDEAPPDLPDYLTADAVTEMITVSVNGTDHHVEVVEENQQDSEEVKVGWACAECEHRTEPQFDATDEAMADHLHYAQTLGES